MMAKANSERLPRCRLEKTHSFPFVKSGFLVMWWTGHIWSHQFHSMFIICKKPSKKNKRCGMLFKVDFNKADTDLSSNSKTASSAVGSVTTTEGACWIFPSPCCATHPVDVNSDGPLILPSTYGPVIPCVAGFVPFSAQGSIVSLEHIHWQNYCSNKLRTFDIAWFWKWWTFCSENSFVLSMVDFYLLAPFNLDEPRIFQDSDVFLSWMFQRPGFFYSHSVSKKNWNLFTYFYFRPRTHIDKTFPEKQRWKSRWLTTPSGSETSIGECSSSQIVCVWFIVYPYR